MPFADEDFGYPAQTIQEDPSFKSAKSEAETSVYSSLINGNTDLSQELTTYCAELQSLYDGLFPCQHKTDLEVALFEAKAVKALVATHMGVSRGLARLQSQQDGRVGKTWAAPSPGKATVEGTQAGRLPAMIKFHAERKAHKSAGI